MSIVVDQIVGPAPCEGFPMRPIIHIPSGTYLLSIPWEKFQKKKQRPNWPKKNFNLWVIQKSSHLQDTLKTIKQKIGLFFRKKNLNNPSKLRSYPLVFFLNFYFLLLRWIRLNTRLNFISRRFNSIDMFCGLHIVNDISTFAIFTSSCIHPYEKKDLLYKVQRVTPSYICSWKAIFFSG